MTDITDVAPSSDALVFDDKGLIPAVVQDYRTGRILMVAWMNRESYEKTISSGRAYFWSRSRHELWMKGETSGNTLTVTAVAADCDSDTLLVSATPAGPSCHTGDESCFDADRSMDEASFAELGALWRTVDSRRGADPSDSYTASLMAAGVDTAARKVAEEATEVLMAARDHSRDGSEGRLVEETADLLYHVLVLLAERDVEPALVMQELHRRSG